MKSNFIWIILASLSFVFFGTTSLNAQQGTNRVSTEEELTSDLKVGPCKNSDRTVAVKELFKRMGATDEAIKVDDLPDVKNVFVIKKGKTDETIIVGAHYDKVSDGCGTIDNWSGVVILAHLYRTLSTLETEKSFVFVAFDKEEIGLVGARAMAKAIPKEKRVSYCSMVNLDSFGLGYPVILENASNPKMSKAAKDLAAELKMPITGVNLSGAADADSTAFNEKDIPAITLSALSGKWPEILHSSKDKIENVVAGSVRVGYQFGIQYIGKLDSATCSIFRKDANKKASETK